MVRVEAQKLVDKPREPRPSFGGYAIRSRRTEPFASSALGSQPRLEALSAVPFWLPARIDFVLAKPIASAEMIAKELGATPRATRTGAGACRRGFMATVSDAALQNPPGGAAFHYSE